MKEYDIKITSHGKLSKRVLKVDFKEYLSKYMLEEKVSLEGLKCYMDDFLLDALTIHHECTNMSSEEIKVKIPDAFYIDNFPGLLIKD